MVSLDLVGAAEGLGSFLCHLLECRPALVQILDLNSDLLRRLSLTHCGEALGDGVQLNQTGLVCLQILHQGKLSFRKQVKDKLIKVCTRRDVLIGVSRQSLNYLFRI